MSDSNSDSQSFSDAVIDSIADVMNYDLVSVEQLSSLTHLDGASLDEAFAKSRSLTLDEVELICVALGLRPAETLGEIIY